MQKCLEKKSLADDKSIVLAPFSEKISGEKICFYINTLRNWDKYSNVTGNRGLSFGDLAVKEDPFLLYGFRTPYNKTGNFCLSDIKAMCLEVMKEAKVPELRVGYESIHCFHLHSCGDIFLEVGKSSGYPLTFEAVNESSVEMVLAIAKKMGLETSPVHYARESTIPLKEVVIYARRWDDEEAGKYYIEIRYHHDLVKSFVVYSHGKCKSFEKENDEKIDVYESSSPHTAIRINNKYVVCEIIKNPTEHML